MIRRLWSALIASITPIADGMRVAEYGPGVLSDLERAQQAYDSAKARGDTRGLHAASKALRTARHDALRAEVGL